MSAANCTTHHYACDCREAMFAEMVDALTKILGPLNVCSENPNVPDDTLLPVDFTMGELRQARALIARATDQGEMK